MCINLIWARQFLFSNHWPLLIFFYLKSVTFLPAVFQGMSITTNITFAVIAFVLVLSFAWFDCIRSPNWKGRSVSKTPSNIYYGAFVENSWRFLACNYFLRKASSQMLHRFVSLRTQTLILKSARHLRSGKTTDNHLYFQEISQSVFTCSKLTIMIPERRQWRRYGGVVLVSLLLTLNIFRTLF